MHLGVVAVLLAPAAYALAPTALAAARPRPRAPSPVLRLVVRVAGDDECLDRSRSSLFDELADLTVQGLFAPTKPSEYDQLFAEMRSNMGERFMPSKPSSVLVAEEESELIGSCGLESLLMTPEGRTVPRVSTDAARMRVRTLLSNLVVAGAWRRRGVATRLVWRAEELVREWGHDEIVLKVEHDNQGAQALYRELGYEVIGEDDLAERPVPGVFRVRWVRTRHVVMRKGLRPSPLSMPSAASMAMLRGALPSPSKLKAWRL